MNDDWAYIQIARHLQQTGHIQYNGWAAPMLGWQLGWGDLFLHIIPDPFLALRLSTVAIASALGVFAFFIYRRAGLSTANAVLGAGMLLASPLFLPLAFSYMSDVFGLFTLVLCFGACLQAITARSDRAAAGWLVAAILVDALGGTARQISWLGLVTLCPVTLWTLRRRALVVRTACAALVAAAAFMLLCLGWFARQPFTLQVGFIPPHATGASFLLGALYLLFGALLSVPLFLLPASVPFLTRMSRAQWIRLAWKGSLLAAAFVAFCVALHQRHFLALLFAPYVGNYVSKYGLVAGTSLHGQRPILLGFPVRLFLTVLSLGSLYAVVGVCRDLRQAPSAPIGEPSRWSPLNRLAIPLLLGYCLCLVPRLITDEFFDRYLLLILFFGFLYLLKLYQDFVSPHTPPLAWACMAVFGAFGIAGTHDVFAQFRARVQAIEEVRKAGVAPPAIDGGFEYNGSTQLAVQGYVNGPNLRGVHTVLIPADTRPEPCQTLLNYVLPVVHSVYALSFDPAVCGGRAPFAPVTYTEWLGPHRVGIYVVRVGVPQPVPPA